MRMRRPKHSEERWAACGDLVRRCAVDNPDARVRTDTPALSLSEWFGNDRPVELEIGCGKGSFLRALAARYPERNFIGVENNANVLLSAVEQTATEGIANVRFLLCGAEYLHRYLPPQSLSGLYLNFSCPYPKKGQAGKRLTCPRLIADYRVWLKPGAVARQKTDDRAFFEYSAEQWQAGGFRLQNVCTDLHHSDFADNIETEYESKFVALGRPICRLEAVAPEG